MPSIVDTLLLDSWGRHILEFTASIPAFHAIDGVSYFFSVTESGDAYFTGNFTWAQSNLFGGTWISYNGGGTWADASAVGNGSTAYKLSYSQVPEPATLALLGLGLASLGASCRRKQ